MELKRATPSQRPGIRAELRAALQQLRKLEVQLQACLKSVETGDPHLVIDLYDADARLMVTLSDSKEIFYNLNQYNAADKAARVVLRKGPNYHPGDHVRLFDEVKTTDTDMITVDPEVAADMDLNWLAFAYRAAALQFVLNPNSTYRTRLDLYDIAIQPYPNLSMYDWQASGLVNLNPLHFADKAARVRVETGPAYHRGDHVRLFDEVKATDTDMVTIAPDVAADVDLNTLGFANKAAALQFMLNPNPAYRARLDLYDTVSQPYPNLSMYDWQTGDGLMNLNPLHFADKAAAVRLVLG